MKPQRLSLALGLILVSACQAGMATDSELADAACANQSIQSGCHQMVLGVMEEQMRQKREAAGVESTQHSYLENFETRPAIIENPTGPAQQETEPTVPTPN